MRQKYNLSTHEGLPVGKELWLGSDDICNRYLRREDGIIEVQRIVRVGKNGATEYMTAQEFDAWRAEIRRVQNTEAS